MVDLVRDPKKFKILRITYSAFDGNYLSAKGSQASKVQKIFLYCKQKQKISVFTE